MNFIPILNAAAQSVGIDPTVEEFTPDQIHNMRAVLSYVDKTLARMAGEEVVAEITLKAGGRK